MRIIIARKVTKQHGNQLIKNQQKSRDKFTKLVFRIDIFNNKSKTSDYKNIILNIIRIKFMSYHVVQIVLKCLKVIRFKNFSILLIIINIL